MMLDGAVLWGLFALIWLLTIAITAAAAFSATLLVRVICVAFLLFNWPRILRLTPPWKA